MILMIQVGSLGVTWCNHPLTAGLASKMQLTLKPEPTAQLFYSVLVIIERKRVGGGKQFPIQPSSCWDFQVVHSPPWKGCDETLVLHKLFPDELLRAQSALHKTHHRGIANLGQHLDAPCGNESSLPPSALTLAGVCNGIVFSSYPLV